MSIQDVELIAKRLFFPEGQSKKGKLEDMECCMMDYECNVLKSGDTIDDLFTQRKLSALRLYLGTKSKSNLSEGSKQKSSSTDKSWGCSRSDKERSRASQAPQNQMDDSDDEPLAWKQIKPSVIVQDLTNLDFNVNFDEINERLEEEISIQTKKFVPLLEGCCEGEYREISISYSKTQNSSYSGEVSLTTTCSSRQQCFEIVSLSEPEVMKKGL